MGRLLHGLDLLDAGGVLCRDRRGRLPALAFPLVVVGMNSIAIYLMSQLMKPFVARRFGLTSARPLRRALWLSRSRVILLVFWLICLWLYRQKIFIKI